MKLVRNIFFRCADSSIGNFMILGMCRDEGLGFVATYAILTRARSVVPVHRG